MQDLLQGQPITLQPLGSQSEEKQKRQQSEDDAKHAQKQPPMRRVSTLLQASTSFSVILVQGPAGSGKSLFGWHLFNSYKPVDDKGSPGGAPIPIFVSLPVYRDVILSAPAQLLDKYFTDTVGFTSDELKSLQSQRFIFILDGLDELGTKVNLYQACHLHLWPNSIFVISSRTEFLSDSDIAQYITPCNPITKKPEGDRLAKLYLLPFSEAQRERFIAKFAKKFEHIHHWQVERMD
jgi:hypothetical protein